MKVWSDLSYIIQWPLLAKKPQLPICTTFTEVWANPLPNHKYVQSPDRGSLHTLLCMHACLSGEGGKVWHTNAVVYKNISRSWTRRLKVEIQTYSKAQKPWQRSLLIASTGSFKSKSRNAPNYSPKLPWLRERNKAAFHTNIWEGLSQVNPPCLDCTST